MKTNIFGAKRITNILYGLMVLLPMFSILGRVIYTQSNKNAKDSYSGSNEIQYNYLTSTSTINLSKTYYLNSFNMDYDTSNSCNLFVENFVLVDYSALSSSQVSQITSKNISRLYFTQYQNLETLQLYYSTDGGTEWLMSLSVINYPLTAKFNIVSYSTSAPSMVFSYLYYPSNSNQYYMDNAFEYSLQTFVDDNNLGNVNLFSWFTDMFLDQSKPKNALYLNFVNWYLNYTLLVSSGYLLFMVMIWFTQYVRKIMDKSMYQDFGGF